MHLADYRKKEGLSQKQFGARLDPPVGQTLVSQWECGITRVTLHYSVEIARETKQRVSAKDCLAMYDAAAERSRTTEHEG